MQMMTSSFNWVEFAGKQDVDIRMCYHESKYNSGKQYNRIL